MTKKNSYEPVDASPVKSFFVHMLTRDIRLEEAILDLLDNCVDGILRSQHATNTDRPYEGFRAEIDFKKDSFSISDNCGGIPWSVHDYAFSSGLPVSFAELRAASGKLSFVSTKTSVPKGDQYKPKLPLPKKLDSGKRRISFVKDVDEVKPVGEFLFENADEDASVIGERCFDLIHREARQ